MDWGQLAIDMGKALWDAFIVTCLWILGMLEWCFWALVTAFGFLAAVIVSVVVVLILFWFLARFFKNPPPGGGSSGGSGGSSPKGPKSHKGGHVDGYA